MPQLYLAKVLCWILVCLLFSLWFINFILKLIIKLLHSLSFMDSIQDWNSVLTSCITIDIWVWTLYSVCLDSLPSTILVPLVQSNALVPMWRFRFLRIWIMMAWLTWLWLTQPEFTPYYANWKLRSNVEREREKEKRKRERVWVEVEEGWFRFVEKGL